LIGCCLALLLERAFLDEGYADAVDHSSDHPVAGAVIWRPRFSIPPTAFEWVPLWGIGKGGWIGQFRLDDGDGRVIGAVDAFMMLLILAGLQSMPSDILGPGPSRRAGVSTLREWTLPPLRRFIELGV